MEGVGEGYCHYPLPGPTELTGFWPYSDARASWAQTTGQSAESKLLTYEYIVRLSSFFTAKPEPLPGDPRDHRATAQRPQSAQACPHYLSSYV